MKKFFKVLCIIVAVIMLGGYFDTDVPTSQMSTEPPSEILWEPYDELSAEPLSENEHISATVYITDTGEKYHESDCRYLWRSCHEISLEEAIDSYYEPCSVCSPQQYDFQ